LSNSNWRLRRRRACYSIAAVGFQFEVETLATCRVQLNCHVVLFGGMFA